MSIVSIPKELLLQIFGHLSYTELSRVSLTCRRLKDVSRDPALWRKVTLEYEWIKNSTQACRDHVSRCTSLKEIAITGKNLGMHGGPAVGGGMATSVKVMSVILKAKRTLTSIILSSSLSNPSLQKISKMTQLRKLAFDGEQVKADGIANLASLTELRSLKLPNRRVTLSELEAYLKELVNLFVHLKKLEEVDIKMNRLSDEVVESLVVNNPNLRHLDISSTSYRSDSLSTRSATTIAENCHQLTYIEIENCSGFSRNDIQNLITACPKLKHASFGWTNIDDIALGLLSHNCPELEGLSLVDCWRVSEQGLEGLISAAPNLKYLDIRNDIFASPGFARRVEQEYPHIKILYDDDE